MAYFCTHCGHPIPGLNQHCTQCGAYLADPLAAVSAVSRAVPAAQPRGPQDDILPFPESGGATHKRGLPWYLAAGVGVFILGAVLFFTIRSARPAGEPRPSALSSLAATATELARGRTVDNAEPARLSSEEAADQLTTPAKVSAATPEPNPTATQRPTPTAAEASACPGAPKQRLAVGENARVCTRRDNVFIRSGPAKSYAILERVAPGTLVEVTGGPECADDWSFWEIELTTGVSGWMSEGGDDVDAYFLCPVEP